MAGGYGPIQRTAYGHKTLTGVLTFRHSSSRLEATTM